MTSSPPSCFQSRARFGLSGARSVFKIFHICEMPAAESDRMPFLYTVPFTVPSFLYLLPVKMLYVSDKILFSFPQSFVIMNLCVKCEGVKKYDGSQDRIPDLSR